MELLQSLTDHFKNNGVKNLEAWAEDGTIHFSPSTPEGGFEIKYVANLEISVTEMEPKRLFMLLVSWVHAFNSEREGQDLSPPQFFSERLDGKGYDIGFKVEFIEQFNLLENPNGEWLVNGVTASVTSNFDESIHYEEHVQLRIVDAHTQDTELNT